MDLKLGRKYKGFSKFIKGIFYSGTESIRASVCNTSSSSATAAATTTARFLISS
jgi:hypothetical protein